MSGMLILKVIVLMTVFYGIVIFVMRQVFFSSTEGAVQRLSKETEEARAKQAELDTKIKNANEELAKRKKEAEELAKKMLEEAEAKAKEERDKIVKRARETGEEIIDKAQKTRDQVRQEIEKETDLKMISYASDLLNDVLGERACGALNKQLLSEFIENLQKVDMNQIGEDVKSADIITVSNIDADIKNKICDVIKKKLGREIVINTTVDPNIVGGAVLRFGSLALDASLKNIVIEAATARKEKKEGET